MKEIKRDVARHLFFVVQWRYRIFVNLYNYAKIHWNTTNKKGELP